VMQFQFVDPVDRIASAPSLGRSVTAGDHEPVQDGHEDNPLDGKLELSASEHFLEDLWDAQLLPDPLEDQRRPDVEGRLRLDTFLAHGADHGGLFGEFGAGSEHRVELARFTQPVEPPERRDDALLDPAAAAFVVNDLKILVAAGFFTMTRLKG
jgi:hypothetical protein